MKVDIGPRLAMGGIMAALVVADRVCKMYFLTSPGAGRENAFIIGSWLLFHFEKNQGIAFGLAFPPIPLLILSAVASLVLWYLGYTAWLRRRALLAAGFFLAGLGAFSNFWDRIAYGFVIDYIDVPYFTVFNLADIMITFGIGIIIFCETAGRKKFFH